MALEGAPLYFNSLEEYFEVLKQHELETTSRFVAIASTKSFGLTELDSTRRRNVLWSGPEPYICLGKKILHCHHGKDKHTKQKERYAKEKNRKGAIDHRYARQGRLRVQPTKKLGCPAKVTIKEVLVFPDVKVGDGSKRSRALAGSAIRSSSTTNGKKMFMMTVPDKEEHTNHPVGEFGGLSQRIDASIVGEIHQLVDDGVDRPEEIQRHLKTHLQTAGLRLVPESNRRFYPTRRTIRSHMDYHETKRLKWPDDQQNLKDLNFLMVYQSAWMRKLLCRYGNQMTMLDATYRTCRFALPLFFLAVRTNVDHQVVGIFVVEDEKTSSIKEALHIIVAQNPLWKPSFYMTDFDEREIGAMDQLFPEARGIICDFHVMQAWKRWLKKKKHGVQEDAATLAALRKLRIAASIEEFDSSLTELKASSIWSPISSYFEKVWLPQKKKWAQCYRSGEITIGIHTNNGIEGLNSGLKRNYLKGKTIRTLTKMVGILVKKFLPDKHKCYIDENLKMTGTLKAYHDNVPEFLKQRPPAFIEHCIKRIELSKDCKEVVHIGEGIFCVNTYQVWTGDGEAFPGCSCPDFRHYILPCKHLFRAITEANVVHWDRLSSKYRASPYFNVDYEVLGTEQTGKPSADTSNTIVEEDDLTQFYDVHIDMINQGGDTVKTSSIRKELREVLDDLKSRSFLIEDRATLMMITQQIKDVQEKIPKSTTLKRLPTTERLKLRKKKKKVVMDRFGNDRMLNRKETDTVSDSIVCDELGQKTEARVIPHKTDVSESVGRTFKEYQGDHSGERNEIGSQAAADELQAFKLVSKLWKLPKDYNIPVAKVMGSTVTDTDIRSVKGSGWLTDNIMDCYLKMVCQWECDKGRKTLHLVATQVDEIVNGMYNTKSAKFKLSEYEVVVGVYNRSSHWVLIVADIASSTLFFYNPINEQEDEMKLVLDGWSQFVNFYSHQNGDCVGTKWSITTQPHVRQVDSYSCGVYCLIFAEKHLSGESLMDVVSLEDMRKKVATKVMLFEEYLTGCCPKCGCLIEDDEKMQCGSCLGFYHFKPYCIQDDIDEMHANEQFKCKLCRINFWPLERCSKALDAQGKTVEWTEKELVLSKLTQAIKQDQDITEVTEEVKKYSERTRKRKKQRPSFIYPPLKKRRKLYCVCCKPNDGKLYWKCEGCEKWFHPTCLGRSADTEPTSFICPACLEMSSEERSEFVVPSVLNDADDKEDGDVEESFFITAETVCKHMRAAIKRVESIVAFHESNRKKPWMSSHNCFRKGARATMTGYGFAVFSYKAIECTKFYIRKQLFKYEYRRAYYRCGTIIGLRDKLLESCFVQDIHLAAIYVAEVMVREGLAAIFQSATGTSYDTANTELTQVLDKSLLNATQHGIELSAAKKVELGRLYGRKY